MIRNILVAIALTTVPLGTCGHAASVRDDMGRLVALPRDAQRIVTLSPHATELVVAAGAGGRLAGIAAGGTPPDQLRALPRVGGPGALDREALLALQPDLVIAWQTGNRASDLDWIAGTGIALYRSEPESLDGVAATIRHIGELSGTQPQAEHSAQRFEQYVGTPCAALPRQPVFVVIWERPAMTLGGRHWINAVLQAAGYRNLYAHIDRGAFHIAPEAALAHADLPHLSLVRSYDNSESDILAHDLSRPGPRLAEAAQLLCDMRLRQESLHRGSR